MKTLDYRTSENMNIEIGNTYYFGQLWDGDGDGRELLESGSISPDNDGVVEFRITEGSEDILDVIVEVTDCPACFAVFKHVATQRIRNLNYFDPDECDDVESHQIMEFKTESDALRAFEAQKCSVDFDEVWTPDEATVTFYTLEEFTDDEDVTETIKVQDIQEAIDKAVSQELDRRDAQRIESADPEPDGRIYILYDVEEEFSAKDVKKNGLTRCVVNNEWPDRDDSDIIGTFDNERDAVRKLIELESSCGATYYSGNGSPFYTIHYGVVEVRSAGDPEDAELEDLHYTEFNRY